MERAPLPPHERPWRHPSELAATHSAAVAAEPTSQTTRVVTLASGAMALLVIGVLVVSMSPDRGPGGASGAAVPSTVASALLSTPRASPPDTADGTALPVALPRVTAVGDGLVGLTTTAAIRRTLVDGGTTDWIEAELHTGDVVRAKVLVEDDLEAAGGDVVLVELAAEADQAVQVATSMPDDDDVVVVLTDPPVEVPMSRVRELGAEDGTPVLDGDGHLVGLCTNDERGPGLVGVADRDGEDDLGGGRVSDDEPADDATNADQD